MVIIALNTRNGKTLTGRYNINVAGEYVMLYEAAKEEWPMKCLVCL